MDERTALKKKYPGLTDDLLEKILIDDNPQRKADVLATMDEYMKFATDLDPLADDVYRYLNFDEIKSFQKSALKAKSKIEEIPISVVN